VSDEFILLKSYSVPQKNVQLDSSMVLNSTEAACKSSTESLKKNFSKFVDDPVKFLGYKERKEDDNGQISCVSSLPEKLAEQIKVKQQLALILKEDDGLLNSPKADGQVCKADLSKSL